MIENMQVNNNLESSYKIHNYQSVCADYSQMNKLRIELKKYATIKCQKEFHDKNIEEYKTKEIVDEWVGLVLGYYQEQYSDLNSIIGKIKEKIK